MEKIKEKQQKKHTVGNGEGSLFYSESQQKWIYQWTEGFDSSGKQNKKQIKQRKNETKKDFLKRKTELENSRNNGTYIEKSKDTLRLILERFVNQKTNDGILSESSYVRVTATLDQLKKTCFNFIDKPVQKVTEEDIEDAKPRMSEYSQSCIDKMWGFLNNGFQIAYSRRKINYNIMLSYSLNKPISKKETKFVEALTVKEEKRFIELLDVELRTHKYRNAVKMQLLTGMRIGEVLARSTKNYNEKDHTLLVDNTLTRDKRGKTKLGTHTKTYNKKTNVDKGKRTLLLTSLNPEVEQIIKEQISKKITNIHGLLFWDYEDNTFISRVEINSWLKRINDKYKITNNNLSSHVLRHTYVTRLREKGVDMKIIQYLVGHVEGSSITDDVYTSVSNDFIIQELNKISL